MFELIKDNRTGNKLEIFVPTYNEEKRIGNILNYYGNEFDIVLADGNSTDNTVKIAINAGATVFGRLQDNVAYGEYYFVGYVNNFTKSGYCFYLFADEYVTIENLRMSFELLQQKKYVIMGLRHDWVYGVRMPYSSGLSPKGLFKGIARFNPVNLHQSLEYIIPKDLRLEEIIIDIEHLHICNSRRYYGTAAKYAFVEVEQFMRQKYTIWHFLNRFVKPIISFPIKKMWRIRNFWIAMNIWVNHWAAFLVAICCLIERRYLLSPEQQMDKYKNWYKCGRNQV